MGIFTRQLLYDLSMASIPILLNNEFIVEDRRTAYNGFLVSVVSQR